MIRAIPAGVLAIRPSRATHAIRDLPTRPRFAVGRKGFSGPCRAGACAEPADASSSRSNRFAGPDAETGCDGASESVIGESAGVGLDAVGFDGDALGPACDGSGLGKRLETWDRAMASPGGRRAMAERERPARREWPTPCRTSCTSRSCPPARRGLCTSDYIRGSGMRCSSPAILIHWRRRRRFTPVGPAGARWRPSRGCGWC